MQLRKLLVLDVEGTIIIGYDYNSILENDRFPAVIDEELASTLKDLSLEFDIVLATGTEGNNLTYYESEFKKAGISDFIKQYSPADHADTDSKTDKLQKYAKQFNISDNNHIYFFDDAKNNIDAAKKAGFINSCQVTTLQPLVDQLLDLVDVLKLKEKNAISINNDIDDHSFWRFFGSYKNYEGPLKQIPSDSILNAPVEEDNDGNLVVQLNKKY